MCVAVDEAGMTGGELFQRAETALPGEGAGIAPLKEIVEFRDGLVVSGRVDC